MRTGNTLWNISKYKRFGSSSLWCTPYISKMKKLNHSFFSILVTQFTKMKYIYLIQYISTKRHSLTNCTIPRCCLILIHAAFMLVQQLIKLPSRRWVDISKNCLDITKMRYVNHQYKFWWLLLFRSFTISYFITGQVVASRITKQHTR